MSQKDKLLRRIRDLGDISFQEAARFLTERGYISRSAGSHHTWSKPGAPSVTIRFQNPIHRDAVKDLRRILDHQP